MVETKTTASAATAPAPSPNPIVTDAEGRRCVVCGNHYHRAFEVVVAGGRHVFDSFECAIELLAPRCAQCRCRVIGHGVEDGELIYCCEHCLRHHREGARPAAA
jgi:hypothetical protein